MSRRARRPKLRAAARDAWALAGVAIEAGLVGEARALADRAIEVSGWEPYLRGHSFWPRATFRSPLIPPAWTYLGHEDGMSCLLIHPSAAMFVGQLRSLRPLFDAAEERDGGLLPLDELMATAFIATMTPPDDISALSAA